MSYARPAPGPAPTGSDAETLEEMLEVLRLAASIRAPERAMAVRYMEARARLVAGRLKSFVPPFLTQCVSIFKFQDFIRLYAPDAAQRIQFVEQSFEPCRRATGFTRRYDVFGEDA
jgi:hypothetical protein